MNKPRTFSITTGRGAGPRFGLRQLAGGADRGAYEGKAPRSAWLRIAAVICLLLVVHTSGARILTQKADLGSALHSTDDVETSVRFNVGGRGPGSRDSNKHSDEVAAYREKKRLRKLDLVHDSGMKAFCKRVKDKPVPFDKSCSRRGANMTCIDGRDLMFSQFHQDYYLYTRHFKHLKRSGTYMDVAANDAVGISNSYFFDACLGWEGICVEGNPRFFERLYRVRSCALVPTCVGRVDGMSVEFALEGGAGGVMGSTYKHQEKWAEIKKQVQTIKERCTTLRVAMDREEMHEVDYLSLDVEGHELEVLKGIDWGRSKFNVMTIEVTKKTLPEIEAFMTGLGYKRHMPDLDEKSAKNGLLRDDAVFLHPDVVWGSPV